jgi:hypothetical protein
VNSLALKYLDDNMLSLLAAASAGGKPPRKKTSATKDSSQQGVTQFGLSDVTMATAQFLRDNRLVAGGHEEAQRPNNRVVAATGPSNPAEHHQVDFHQLLQKPKFT